VIGKVFFSFLFFKKKKTDQQEKRLAKK
jgi:hypothetical protein